MNFLVKVGIIGFGYMGHYHYKKFKQMGEAIVTAVYDTDSSKLTEAEDLGMKAVNSLEEFLNIPDMDLVVISTPNQFHAPYAIKVLNAGKNVLCEKPAVLNAQELEEILSVSRKTGKFFTVHHNRRWDRDYLTLKKVIANGTIGQTVMVESRVLGERGVVYGWRGDPTCGGGMLYDWGPHLIDQVLNLFPENKVEYVEAQLLSVLTPAVDDFVMLSLYFDNGVRANIQIGTMALQKMPRWFVYGDRGSMKLDDFTGEVGGIARIKGTVKGFDSVLGKKNLGPSRTMAPLEPENLEGLKIETEGTDLMAYHKNIVDAVLGKAEPFVGEKDILRETNIIDAAFKASREKRILKVNI